MKLIFRSPISRIAGYLFVGVLFSAGLCGAGISTTETGAVGARIVWLRAELARHDDLYFRKAKPEITDAGYDALKRELASLQEPGESVGAIGDDRGGSFPPHLHRERMLSLEKAYSETELRRWCERLESVLAGKSLEFVVEPKVDGIAISVTYEKGKLVRAATRGNGSEGEDITANALTIRSLPRELRAVAPSGARNPMPDIIELRGEIYVGFREFERLNSERENENLPPFSHPRNLAAGTVKLQDPDEVARRGLDVVFYGWGACEPTSVPWATQSAFTLQARAWGLPTLPVSRKVQSTDEICAFVQEFQRTLRKNLGFPTDGLVVKVDEVALRGVVGEADAFPRWAVAYKFAPEQAFTNVRAITIQVGRTGRLTPVAELTPVELAGSTVSRATLHNRDVIQRLDVRVGDTVVLEKAGEIIPAIVAVDKSRRLQSSEAYVFPARCPECGEALMADGDTDVPRDSGLRCGNQECAARVRRKIAHYVASVGIDGLGDATIAQLVSGKTLRRPADLYRLRLEDLLALERVGERSASRIISSIEASRRVEMWRALRGLGIPGVGAASGKALIKRFGVLSRVVSASESELTAVLGAARARGVTEFFADRRNRDDCDALCGAGVGRLGE